MESQRDLPGRAHIAPCWSGGGGGDGETALIQAAAVARPLPCRKPVGIIESRILRSYEK